MSSTLRFAILAAASLPVAQAATLVSHWEMNNPSPYVNLNGVQD